MNSVTPAADSAFELFRVIGRLRAEMVNAAEQEMAAQGVDLNYTQFLALKILGQEPPMTPVELARNLHYNPGALTRLLDKLEHRGYLCRVPDPGDRRALRLELTGEGKTLRRRVIGYFDALATRTFACTTERERRQLREVLDRVLAGVHALREHRPST